MQLAPSAVAAIALIAAALTSACEPAPGRFRPRALRSAPCVSLPVVGPREPNQPVPIVDRDLNRDRQDDYIFPRLETCDELQNCDHDVYWIRESCALHVGRVRGKEIDVENGALVTREVFVYEGETGARETWWTIGAPRYQYEISEPPRCQLPSFPDSHRCDGQPDEPARGGERGEGGEGGEGEGGEGGEGGAGGEGGEGEPDADNHHGGGAEGGP